MPQKKNKKKSVMLGILLLVIVIGIVLVSLFFVQQEFWNPNPTIDFKETPHTIIQIPLSDLEGDLGWYGGNEDICLMRSEESCCEKDDGDDRCRPFNKYRVHTIKRFSFTIQDFDTSKYLGTTLSFEYRPSQIWNDEYPFSSECLAVSEGMFTADEIYGFFDNSFISFTIDSPCTENIIGKYYSDFNLCDDLSLHKDLVASAMSCAGTEQGDHGVQTFRSEHPNNEWLHSEIPLKDTLPGVHTIDLYRYDSFQNGQIDLNNVILNIYLETDEPEEPEPEIEEETEEDEEPIITDPQPEEPKENKYGIYIWGGIAIFWILIIIYLIYITKKKKR